MPKKNTKIWFPAKTCGWGWGPPVSWQGWVVVAVYIILVVAGIFSLSPDKRPLAFVGYMIALTIGLLFICWLKGEKPGWRCKKK